MPVDDLYWLFSTIAQTLGAIVGLIGMISVYRLQGLSNSKREIMNRTIDARKSHFGLDAFKQTPEEFVEDCWKKIEAGEIGDSGHGTTLKVAWYQLTDVFRSRETIILPFRLFLIFNLAIIFLSILALPFCKVLVRLKGLTVSMTAIALAICFLLTMFLSLSLIAQKKVPVQKPNKTA